MNDLKRTGSEPSRSVEANQESHLREIIRRHKIYWQTWPELRVDGSRRRQVGLRLGLFGTHAGAAHLIAGCPESREIYARLRDLACWVLPKDEGGGLVGLSEFDASLLYRGDREDVLITIVVLLPTRPAQSGYGDDLRGLEEMEEELLRLGAPRDQWVEPGLPPESQ